MNTNYKPDNSGLCRSFVITQLFLLIVIFSSAAFALDNMRPHLDLNPTQDGLEVILDFSHIQPRQWSNLLARPLNFHEAGYGLAGEAGEPALPLITELIPVDSIIAPEIFSLNSEDHLISPVVLKKSPALHLESDPPVIVQTYSWPSDDSRQSPIAKLGTPVTLQGKTYLPLTIYPVALDIREHQVRVLKKISVEIKGVAPGQSEELDRTGNVRSVIPDDELYGHLGHYLMITPPVFEPYLQPLVEWKQRMGHPVTVVSTNETGQTPASIKAFIQNAYDTWEDPPEYVLLIGDEDRGIGGFYVYNPDNEALITDHPYVLLAGEDSFPEAWVGRLSVDTISELATVIGKILHYERDPYTSDPAWFKRALMVCTVSAASSTQDTKNWVSRKLAENGFTQIDTAYYPMQSSLSRISTPINNGVGFVNYRGLGAWDHWIGPYFYNSDIALLHNGFKLPIVTSIVCGGGNFAAPIDPCFGEKWIRTGSTGVPKGAVAFIGPSEVHTHTQFNNVIDVGLYSGIFDQGITELGPALWHAKLELWRNYYQSEYLPFGQSADFYINIYNILGDPGLSVWTDTPGTLVVDAPEILSSSDDHIHVTVRDETGTGVPLAFVYLFNNENAAGLRTDAAGAVTLPFQPGADSTVFLTITGRNLKPFQASIPISDAEYPVSYSSWMISENGLLEAGETTGMDFSLINHIGSITELTLTLSSRGDVCTIIDSVHVIENFQSGSILELSDIFEIEVAADARQGDIADLELTVSTGSENWIWQHNFLVQSPDLYISGVEILEGNLIAGDSIRFRLNIGNQGGAVCPPLTLTLEELDLAEAEIPVLSCPAIGIDEIESTEGECLLVLSDQIFPGEPLRLSFISDLAGNSDPLCTTIIIEDLDRFAPSLPDDYGYRVFDDLDVSFSLAPEYNWLEIDPELGGGGSRLEISDGYEENDGTVLFDLPFPVNYYGQTYETMTICSNGWLAMGNSPEVSPYNRVIPSASGPNAMIAPFWDDLVTASGGISTMNIDGRLIVEWSRVSPLQINSVLNFQVIIYDTVAHPTLSGDNQIKIQFMDYHNYDTFANFSTTGIESPDYTTGLQTSFNNITETSVGSLHSAQALLFTTERATRYAPSELTLDQLSLDFVLNPWSSASDSIALTNSGGSPLVYTLEPLDELDRQPAPNPVAAFEFIKGGPEPDGLDLAPVERDLFDYEWKNQEDPDGPEFSWRDISMPAFEVDYPGDPDDIAIGPIDLGFEFPFYSETYSSFFFSSNGSMSFESAEHPWRNLPLPNGMAPAALIAPWWDDLNNDDGIQGVPYFWSNGLDTAVVCWDNFPKFGTADFHTFQVILVGNGDIIFQYLEMEGTGSSSTVGIQNVWKNRGLQVTYNTPNTISTGTAIRIRRESNWLRADTWSGRVEIGETGYFSVSVDTRNLVPGNFSVPLLLRSNAANMPETPINISLEIIHGIPPEGDVNEDYQVNVSDLIALIDFALSIESPDAGQFERADLVDDGELNVLDTVRLIEILSASLEGS